MPGNFLFRLKLEVARHATDPSSAQDAYGTRYHAITFEGLATLILAPTAAWLMQRSVVEMGGAESILLATLAMVWDIIYNAMFDQPVAGLPLSPPAESACALHALGFETGFIIIGVTMVAIVLGVSLLQAFMLEIGFMLFFLPYTMAFNWAWGHPARARYPPPPTPAGGARVVPRADPPRSAATLSPKTIATDEP
ncbi:PACE efflux transporter [Klebsiella variicola subsp. variicola]|nr:PACE efflux transporter [Klebsiella variicola subsp. variicola]